VSVGCVGGKTSGSADPPPRILTAALRLSALTDKRAARSPIGKPQQRPADWCAPLGGVITRRRL
jgi:hypothetical protein